jgi:hypothetical protein
MSKIHFSELKFIEKMGIVQPCPKLALCRSDLRSLVLKFWDELGTRVKILSKSGPLFFYCEAF